MSYPTSCGTDGNVVDISLACMNDLWSGNENKCTTTLAATSDPKAFALVGSTPALLPFSTYGQTLSKVSYNIEIAQNSDILCKSGTYINPTTEGISVDEKLIGYNTQLNGLVAQYSYLHDQYITLFQRPPSNIDTTMRKVTNIYAESIANPSPANTTKLEEARKEAETANTAYSSVIENIKADIDKIYLEISTLSNTINSSLVKLEKKGTVYETSIQTNVNTLLKKIEDMNKAFINLKTETEKPNELDGSYEVSQMKTSSNFMKHLLYILFALLIGGCLIFINIFPTEGKLDMFILGLGVIVLVYYIYDYYEINKK